MEIHVLGRNGTGNQTVHLQRFVGQYFDRCAEQL